MEDILTFADNDTFVQVLEPYPTDACDINSVIWEGTYIQLNQTNFRMAFVYCEITKLGCLNCTPSGDFQITSKFQADCSSFTYQSQDESQGVRTYYRFDDVAAPTQQLAADAAVTPENGAYAAVKHDNDEDADPEIAPHQYYYVANEYA